jgi:phosphatidylinositol alpha-1,6-mannosyltransferase
MLSSVLALVTEAYGGYGGIAQYNSDLLDAFGRSTEVRDISVIARRRTPISSSFGRRARIISSHRSRTGFMLAALIRGVLHRYEIVFCGHINFALLAFTIARIQGARLIVQTHGIEVWKAPAWWNRYAVDHADLVLAVSRYTRAQLLTWTEIQPERIIVVANTYREQFCTGDAKEARIRIGLHGKKVLLTVGRLDARQKHKGHDRMIRLLPRLRNEYPNLVYVVVGEGSDRKRLESLANQCGVASMVQFRGRVSADELVEYYRAADLLVMPSTGDGFGIVFLEAIACGTAVVGLDTGGVRDAMADGDLGQAVREEELGDTVIQALAPGRASESNLPERLRARFGRQVFVSRIESLIGRLVNDHATTR